MNDLTPHLSIVFEDANFPRDKLDGIHELLRGSPDYVDCQIVLNIEDGLFLSFDFNDKVKDRKDMFKRLKAVIDYIDNMK